MSPPKSPKLMAAMEKSVPPNSGLWCKVGSIAGTRPPQGISPKLCSRFVTRPVVHRQNVWPAIGRKQMSELFKFPDVFVRQGNFNANSCGNINAAGTPNSEYCKSAGNETRSVLLRDDHVVLWAIDGLVALHVAFVNGETIGEPFVHSPILMKNNFGTSGSHATAPCLLSTRAIGRLPSLMPHSSAI